MSWDSFGSFEDVVVGGALVGLALASLRVLTGRVMSTSGMMGTLMGGGEGPAAASIAFIGGVCLAPTLWLVLASMGTPLQMSASKPVEAGWPLLVAGGLLAGFGARLGRSGLTGAIWGSVRRSAWSGVALGAIVLGIAVTLFAHRLVGSGGAA